MLTNLSLPLPQEFLPELEVVYEITSIFVCLLLLGDVTNQPMTDELEFLVLDTSEYCSV